MHQTKCDGTGESAEGSADDGVKRSHVVERRRSHGLPKADAYK